ncbi:MAG: hypothetical protein ACREON_01145 [Gemmatimonadaceae bacterium]
MTSITGRQLAHTGATFFRHLLPLAVVAALACARGEQQEAGDTAAGSVADNAPAASSSSGGSLTGDVREVANYRLSMDKVEKWVAAMSNLQTLSENDPELKRWAESQDMGNNASLRDMQERLESTPKIRRAIERAGISTEDFVLTQIALLQAAMVHGIQKSGAAAKNVPLPEGVSEDNVKFFRENEARLTELMESMREKDG